MEHPIKIWMIWLYPHFRNPQICPTKRGVSFETRVFPAQTNILYHCLSEPIISGEVCGICNKQQRNNMSNLWMFAEIEENTVFQIHLLSGFCDVASNPTVWG